MATEAIDHTILIVDDEEAILSALKRLFNKLKIPIMTFSTCDEALEKLEVVKDTVTLIISDQRMPGMNGVEFLEKSREYCPGAIRFLLTGFSDMETVIDGVNKGQIHRYLSKPWNDDEMLGQVQESLKQYELINENKRLLDLTQKHTRQLFKFSIIMKKKVNDHAKAIAVQNTAAKKLEKELEESHYNTIKTISKVVEDNIPLTEDHGSRVSLLARELALKAGVSEKEISEIELAALSHDIGKIRQPAEMSKKLVEQLNEEEMVVYKNHPEEGQKILSFSERLEGVGKIIRHHHEHFDGSGWPDGISGKEIPIGAKIVSIADAYDRIEKMGESSGISGGEGDSASGSPEENSDGNPTASAYIKEQSGKKFDPDIVKVFIEEILNEEV